LRQRYDRAAVSDDRDVRGRRGQRNIEAARAMFGAFIAQDTERMIGLSDPRISVAGGPIAERTGRTDPYRGHEGLRELARDLAKTWSEVVVTPQEYRAIAGAVLVSATLTAHSSSSMLTGSVAWVYRVRRRKVVSVEVFRCYDDALATLGGR
jgi:hypothetical protein